MRLYPAPVAFGSGGELGVTLPPLAVGSLDGQTVCVCPSGFVYGLVRAHIYFQGIVRITLPSTLMMMLSPRFQLGGHLRPDLILFFCGGFGIVPDQTGVLPARVPLL